MDTMTKPKQRDAPKTKARILAAAQQAFSKQGYGQAGIRDIAAIACVSSTLLLRYFGSKAGLFEAALIEAVRLDPVLRQDKDSLGAHLAAIFTRDALDIRPPSMIALSIGDEEARAITTRVMEEHIIQPLAKWLGPPDARLRAIEITSLSLGFVLYTRQLPLTSAKSEERKLAKRLARAIQDIVDQSGR